MPSTKEVSTVTTPDMERKKVFQKLRTALEGWGWEIYSLDERDGVVHLRTRPALEHALEVLVECMGEQPSTLTLTAWKYSSNGVVLMLRCQQHAWRTPDVLAFTKLMSRAHPR